MANDTGSSLAELAVCIPLLGLVFSAIITYGNIRQLENVINISSYLAAIAESRGLSGEDAARTYLDQCGYRDKDAISVNTKRRLSILTSVDEAEIEIKVKPTGFMRLIHDDNFIIKSKTEWYSPGRVTNLVKDTSNNE